MLCAVQRPKTIDLSVLLPTDPPPPDAENSLLQSVICCLNTSMHDANHSLVWIRAGCQPASSRQDLIKSICAETRLEGLNVKKGILPLKHILPYFSFFISDAGIKLNNWHSNIDRQSKTAYSFDYE